jgi:Cft2 family RNA processing exonuclease
MLGSVSFSISFMVDNDTKRTIVFTGDIGSNSDDSCHLPLLRSCQVPYGTSNYIVLESTYGNRQALAGSRSPEERLKAWREVIDRCHRDKGGTVIIAAFAAHRTQEILFDLYLLLRQAPDLEDAEFAQPDLDALRNQNFSYAMIKAWIDSTPDRDAAAIAPTLFHFDLSKATQAKLIMDFTADDRVFLERFRGSQPIPHREAEQALSIVEKNNRLLDVRVRLRDDFSLSDCPEAIGVLKYLKWLPNRIALTLDSPTARRITACYGELLDQTDQKGKPLFRNAEIADILGIDDSKVGLKLQELFPTRTDGMTTLDLASGWIRLLDKARPALLNHGKADESRIILSSSGMCDVGPIVEHLKRGISDQRNTVVLTGYQAPGSVGSHLLALRSESDGSRTGREIMIGGTPFKASDVKAEIETLGHFYSGHADQDGLLDFLFEAKFFKEVYPCTVFLNHGTDQARAGLRDAIFARAGEKRQTDRPIMDVHLPGRQDAWFDLASGQWLLEESEPDAMSAGMIVERLDRLIAIGEQIVKLLETGSRSGSGVAPPA